MESDLREPETLTIDEANALVVEHRGWAESIARSVARAWNMDWRLDGLDGAAMEALIFCARRFQPARGVPFRGYARKRIHEASADAARKSKGWQRGLGAKSKSESQAREISAELFNVFPELREGQLPYPEESSGDGAEDMRAAVRTMLIGASIVAAKQGISSAGPDDMMDYKKMIRLIASLDTVHQLLLWQVYWDGDSMRTVASEWEVDELSVIREHKALLAYLGKSFADSKPGTLPKPSNKSVPIAKLKIRPALKHVAVKFKADRGAGPFSKLLTRKDQVSEES